jgi:hypothetical protein
MVSDIGFENPLWFMGIVEDNDDKLNNGRVKVRAFGIHPPANSDDVQIEDLPWAPVLNAGHFGTVLPAKSDWVFGFFADGRDAQHPFVVGAIPGQNMQLPQDSGSSSAYTPPSFDAFKNYGESPLPKAMSGEDLETTQTVLQNASRLIFGAAQKAKNLLGLNEENSDDPLPNINEPPVQGSTQPHKNMVWKSRNSESYMQIGEDEEYILLSHESGSHIQIDSSGNIKIKSFGDAHYYSEGHQMEASNGSRVIHIEGGYSLECKDATIQINGDLNHTIKGDYNLNVGGKLGITTGQSFEIAAQRIGLEATTEHMNLKAAEKIKAEAGDNVSLKSGADMYFTSDGTMNQYSIGAMFLNTEAQMHKNSGSIMYTSAGSNLYLTSGGLIAGDGDEIHLNNGLSTTATPATKTPETPALLKLDKPIEQSVSTNSNEVESTSGSIGVGDLDDTGEA